jgi:hypothetical protein
VTSWRTHRELQQTLNAYLRAHGLALTEDARYVSGIDYVEIQIGGIPVLWVGLPPVSDYSVHETEHTDRYLRASKRAVV